LPPFLDGVPPLAGQRAPVATLDRFLFGGKKKQKHHPKTNGLDETTRGRPPAVSRSGRGPGIGVVADLAKTGGRSAVSQKTHPLDFAFVVGPPPQVGGAVDLDFDKKARAVPSFYYRKTTQRGWAILLGRKGVMEGKTTPTNLDPRNVPLCFFSSILQARHVELQMRHLIRHSSGYVAKRRAIRSCRRMLEKAIWCNIYGSRGYLATTCCRASRRSLSR